MADDETDQRKRSEAHAPYPQAFRRVQRQDHAHMLRGSEVRDVAPQANRPDLAQANARVRRLEREDANLRRALRTATPRAAERIQLEVGTVAEELSQAKARLGRLEEAQQPMRITPTLIRETVDEMSGLIEHAGLDTRVAWVHDPFERIDVDSREEHAVAVWKATTTEGVNRSDSVTEWLRR